MKKMLQYFSASLFTSKHSPSHRPASLFSTIVFFSTIFYKKETTRAPTQDRQLSSGNPAAAPVHPSPSPPNSEPLPHPTETSGGQELKDASPLPRRDEQSRQATCSLPEQPAWCDLFFFFFCPEETTARRAFKVVAPNWC